MKNVSGVHIKGWRIQSFALLGLFFVSTLLSSCLNSSSSSGGAVTGGTTDGATGISPTKVHLSWTKATAASGYHLYSAKDENKIIADVKFEEVNLPLEPGSETKIKVYAYDTKGVDDTLSQQFFQFVDWKPFSSAALSAIPRTYAGISVAWNYIPWTDSLPAYKSADYDAAVDSKVRCYFVQNPPVGATDPFIAGAVIVTAPLADKNLNAGMSLFPSTPYLVGCEAVFVDGTTSRHPQTFSVISAASVADDRENAAVDFGSPPIQISKAVTFNVAKAYNGSLTLDFQAVGEDNSSLGSLLNFTRTNFIQGMNNLKLSNPLPDITDTFYGGKYRVTGSFSSNETGATAPIASKDFYVKSVDDPKRVYYPDLTNASTATSMGSATVWGDFDCDGYSDMAVGMPSVSWTHPLTGEIVDSGIVVVYYGSAEGLVTGVPPSFSIQPRVQGRRGPNFIASTTNVSPVDSSGGVGFGQALAVGNFNRDMQVVDKDNGIAAQCMDLAIGAPGEGVAASGFTREAGAGGSVYVILGSADGIYGYGTSWKVFGRSSVNTSMGCSNSQPPFSESNPLPNGNPSAISAYFGPAPHCSGAKIYPFGATLGGLHPYEDGVDDHYIYSIDSAHAFPSTSSGGVSAHANWSITSAFFNELKGGASSSSHVPKLYVNGWLGSGAQFGMSLGAGDLNNDGFDDLIVGAPNAIYVPKVVDPGRNYLAEVTGAGAAFIYFGSGTGIVQNVNGSSPATSPRSPIKVDPVTAVYPTKDARAGSSVAIANLNIEDVNDTAAVKSWAQFFIGASGASKLYYSNASKNPNDSGLTPFDVNYLSDEGAEVAPLYGSGGLGAAMAVGAFRDPRAGLGPRVNNGGSIGLIKKTRTPLAQVLVVGAPNMNSGAGGAYAISSTSSFYSAAAADSLCDTAVDCGSVYMGPPEGAVGFGASVGVAHTPLAHRICSDTSCLGILTVDAATVLGAQPIYDVDYLDYLMIGAPQSSNSVGRAFFFIPSKQFGVSSSYTGEFSGAPLSSGVKSYKDGFGTSVGGGFPMGRIASMADGSPLTLPHFSVGAPKFSSFTTVKAGVTVPKIVEAFGSEFLYASVSSLNTASPLNLAAVTPLSDTAAGLFGVSTLQRSGVDRARPVGDLNCDGFTDVVVPHNHKMGGQTKTELLVLYGSRTGLFQSDSAHSSLVPAFGQEKLINDVKAPHWIDTSAWTSINQEDTDPIKFFAGAGDVNGDGCDDLLVGRKKMVMLYGDSSGLIYGVPPSIVAENKEPQIIEFPQSLPEDYSSDLTPVPATPGPVAIKDWVFGPLSKISGVSNVTSYPAVATPALPCSGTTLTRPAYITQAPNANQDIQGVCAPSSGLPKTSVSLIDQTGHTEWGGVYPDASHRRPPLCHGDFNGDGYADVAIGGLSTFVQRGVSNSFVSPNWVWSIGSVGGADELVNSQIFVFYGGPDGMQTRIKDNNAYRDIVIGGDGTKTPFDSDCTPGAVTTGRARACSPAIVFDPRQFTRAENVPFREWRDSQLRHSGRIYDTTKSIYSRFGELCETVGDVDGDGFDDLLVPLPYVTDAVGGVGGGRNFVIFRGNQRGLRNGAAFNNPLAVQFSLASVKDLSNPSLLPGVAGDFDLRLNDVDTNKNSTVNFGISSAGLGDVNGDGKMDIALGLPGLRSGPIPTPSTDPIPQRGGVLVFYGTSLVSAAPPMRTINSDVVSPLSNSPIMTLNACATPGKSCFGGVLDSVLMNPVMILPDLVKINGTDNLNLRLGEFVDAAGDLNGDHLDDMLLGIPSLALNGKISLGGGLAVFGAGGSTGVDVGWTMSGIYKYATATTDAVCMPSGDAESRKIHCQPLIVLPQYAQDSEGGQSWLFAGGMTIRPSALGLARYRFPEFGTTNIYSVDDGVKTNDILLMPQFNFPHRDNHALKSLGGLTVWQ